MSGAHAWVIALTISITEMVKLLFKVRDGEHFHYDILSPFILLTFFSIAGKEKEERNICYHRKDYILVKFYLHPPDGLVLGHELFISKAKG